MKLTSCNIIEVFISRFPEICKIKEKEIRDLSWEISENLFYVFYEDIVRTYFLYLVKLKYNKRIDEESPQTKLLVELVAFFEEMASNDDFMIREVLEVAIFEFITDDLEILRFIPKILGDKGREVFKRSFNIET